MGGASSIEAAEDACGREKGVITSQHLASTAGWTNGSRRVTKLTLSHTLVRGRVRVRRRARVGAA